jgi:hypothetical protein
VSERPAPGSERRAAHAWSLPNWPSPGLTHDGRSLEVWGYADRFTYLAGESVALHVSSSVPTVEIRVYRDGPTPVTVFERRDFPVAFHAVPREAHAQGCDWPVALEIPVEGEWRPGLYIIVFRAERGQEAFESDAFFVVRKPAGSRSRIAFLLTTSTLLAYNDWGGANHYRGIGDDPVNEIGAPQLATRRPLGRGFLRKPVGAPRESNMDTPPMFAEPRYPAYEWARLHGYSRHHADAFWATYERLFAVWAEEHGYELDYLTQHDLHFDRAALADASTVVIVGHDEYWTWEMRDGIDAFVDRGGGVARFAGNFQWQVRLSPDGATQYCYRTPQNDPMTAHDPTRTTTVWEYHAIGRPGAATMGLSGMGGTYNRYGVAAPRSSGGFTIYRPEHWAFAGTDLYYGDLLGGVPVGLATFELDAVEYTFHRGLPVPTFEDGAPKNLEILALAPAVRGEEDRFAGRVPLNGPMAEAETTRLALGNGLPDYIHESEGRGAGMIACFTRGWGAVFNGGSTEWPRALEVRDPFVEKIVHNVLRRFSAAERAK